MPINTVSESVPGTHMGDITEDKKYRSTEIFFIQMRSPLSFMKGVTSVLCKRHRRGQTDRLETTIELENTSMNKNKFF